MYGGARRHRTTHRRRHMGGSFLNELKTIGSKINNFLRKTRLVSTVGHVLGTAGVPYASAIGNVASTLGYGRRHKKKRSVRRRRVAPQVGMGRRVRRRRHHGMGALSLAGMGLSGGRMHRTRRMHRRLR